MPAKICVIFNPASARGRARRDLVEIERRLKGHVDLYPTDRPGHAEEIARKAVQAGFAVIAAAGGDGTVHEVANGMLSAGRSDAALGVFPLGSANDYAHALGLDLRASLERTLQRRARWVDVGHVRLHNGRERFFVNTLGLGFSGAVTVESRAVRLGRGLLLYGIAFFRALARRFSAPVMEVAFDGQSRRGPTLSLTLAIGRREGNFVVAPDAVVDDGQFDYLQVGPLSRWEVVSLLPRIALGRALPRNHPMIWTGRCRQARVDSENPLIIHTDGELLSVEADGLRAVEADLLPAALRVIA